MQIGIIFFQHPFFNKKPGALHFTFATPPLCWFNGLLLFFHSCVALAAIHGAILSGSEGDLGRTTAGSTHSLKHLPVSAKAVFPRITTGFTALGLVDEASLRVEFLLTGCEYEFGSTLFAC